MSIEAAPVVADPAAVAAPEAVTPPVAAAPVVIDPKIAAEPVVAPVVPPVVAAPEAASDEVVVYEPTGYAGLDVALSFVGNLGIPMTHPAMMATETGDFSLIKAHLATMGDKAQGWEQMVALAEEAFTQDTAKKADTAAKVSAAVVAVAGSAEQWDVMKNWASTNADPAEKTVINEMFDAGPVQARMAAMYVAAAYNAAPGNTVKPAPAVKQDGVLPVANTNGPLSQRDYNAAVQTLYQQLGNRMDASPEYAALRARLSR